MIKNQTIDFHLISFSKMQKKLIIEKETYHIILNQEFN